MLNEGILVHDTVYFHCTWRLAWDDGDPSKPQACWGEDEQRSG